MWFIIFPTASCVSGSEAQTLSPCHPGQHLISVICANTGRKEVLSWYNMPFSLLGVNPKFMVTKNFPGELESSLGRQ